MNPQSQAIVEDAVRRVRACKDDVSSALRIAELTVRLVFSDEERRKDHLDELHSVRDLWLNAEVNASEENIVEMILAELNAVGFVAASESKRHRASGGKGVFVVHGHDLAARDEVVDAIKSIGLNPVVIADMPGSSQTIIELIEQHSDVSYAVCLMTADDIGGAWDGAQCKRARQNVVFEIGYFFALLGRRNVLVMSEPDVEVPSNIGGVRRVAFSSGADLETQLRQEFTAAGVAVEEI